MRPGLAVKLSILLALIGILASGLTGYYAWSANQKLLLVEAGRNLQTATELLSRRLAIVVAEVSDDALTLAKLPASAQVLADRVAPGQPDPVATQLAEVVEALMRVHPEFLQVRLISRDRYGLERVRFDRDGGTVLRIDGDRLQEKGHLPYVFEAIALKPGQVYLAPITVNHEQGAHSADGQATVRLSTPVTGADGRAVGVVVINVDLHRLLSEVQEDVPDRHSVFLTNGWGDFLVHPDPAMSFGFDRGRRILVQDSFPSTRPLLGGTQEAVLINGIDHPQEAGEQILAFKRKAFGPPESRQFVILGLARPLSDVVGGGMQLARSVIQLVLAFSLVSIALAVIFARALTRPLQTLTQAAIRFADARHDHPLPVERQDEIGVLARCFAQMREEIHAHLDLLYQKQRELGELARLDSLTGLPNRLEFLQVLEQAIIDASQHEHMLAVLFIDLDHFKEVNDGLGHRVGDQVLKSVGERLRTVLRHSDLVARLGGDEFTVMIRAPRDSDTVSAIAEKILDMLDQPMELDGKAVKIGASIGVSLFPRDGHHAEDLLARADAAMYAAKAAGRHTSLFYPSSEGPR